MKNLAGLKLMLQWAIDEAKYERRRYPIYRHFDRSAPDMTNFDCLGRREDLIAIVRPDGSVIACHQWAVEALA